MGEAAICWGPRFESVALRTEKGKNLRLRGLLNSVEDLEEVSLSSPDAAHRTVRAFLVKTHRLADVGLKAGDHLLVDATRDLFADPLVLVRTGSGYRLEVASRIRLLAGAKEILGAFIGIIRKRGIAATRNVVESPTNGCKPPTRSTILQGRLAMLEATSANTRNLRLRKALKNEADRVRRQLQNDPRCN